MMRRIRTTPIISDCSARKIINISLILAVVDAGATIKKTINATVSRITRTPPIIMPTIIFF
jgi:hypothetical protein